MGFCATHNGICKDEVLETGLDWTNFSLGIEAREFRREAIRPITIFLCQEPETKQLRQLVTIKIILFKELTGISPMLSIIQTTISNPNSVLISHHQVVL